MTIWIPSPEWRGRTAVVIGTGPSLTLAQIRTVALAHRAGRCKVIAVNDAALVAWFADIVFAADREWWKQRGDLAGFPGRRVSLAECYHDAPFGCVQRIAAEGYDPRPGMICTHANSGAMAVQIAAHLAAERIITVGFDMKSPPAPAGSKLVEQGVTQHFFGAYEAQVLARKPDLSVWVELFRPLAAALAGRLFNATPNSALVFVPPFDLATL